MFKNMMKGLMFGLILLTVVLLTRTLSMEPGMKPEPRVDRQPFHRDGYKERLAGALRIPTISYDEKSQGQPAPFKEFHTYLESAFPLVHQHLQKQVINDLGLIFKWSGSTPGREPILLMAHMDVVPIAPGTEADWIHPPFSGTIADGYIWGRGALDDKASLVGILEATEALLQSGFTPQRTIYLAFGQDEEVGGQQGAVAMANWFAEQQIRFAFVLDEGGMIVEGVSPEGLTALIGIAEKGMVSLELSVKAKGGHSSMPPQQTAVGIVSKAITRLEEHPFPADFTFLTGMIEQMGKRAPFSQRMFVANQWLTSPLLDRLSRGDQLINAMVRTTTAATMISGSVKENVLPARASAVVNFRIIPGETPESVKQEVIRLIDDPRVAVAFYGMVDPPSPVSSITSRGYQVVRDTIYETSGSLDVVVVPGLVIAATDARHYAELSDTVLRFLCNIARAGDLDRLHGTNERISTENYEMVVRFYLNLIRNSAKLDGEKPSGRSS